MAIAVIRASPGIEQKTSKARPFRALEQEAQHRLLQFDELALDLLKACPGLTLQESQGLHFGSVDQAGALLVQRRADDLQLFETRLIFVLRSVRNKFQCRSHDSQYPKHQLRQSWPVFLGLAQSGGLASGSPSPRAKPWQTDVRAQRDTHRLPCKQQGLASACRPTAQRMQACHRVRELCCLVGAQAVSVEDSFRDIYSDGILYCLRVS